MVKSIENISQTDSQLIVNQEVYKINSDKEHDRVFNYILDGKSVQSKLLKGAKRIPFEKENKTNCSVIKFSDGAFQLVIKPFLEYLSKHLKIGDIFKFEQEDVKVVTFIPGYDNDRNHIDTKVVLVSKSKIDQDMSKNNKYTLHIYNSTQKIKVDGKCSIMFVEKSLEPHLIQKIEMENVELCL